MHKVKIFTVGKEKERWLIDALAEYEERLRPRLTVEWHLLKSDAELSLRVQKEGYYIALDPRGKSFSSEGFATFIEKELSAQGCRLAFVIGGAEGLPPPLRSGAAHLISLSPLTFTHQMTRLILLEQIYRALEIGRNSPYHK